MSYDFVDEEFIEKLHSTCATTINELPLRSTGEIGDTYILPFYDFSSCTPVSNNEYRPLLIKPLSREYLLDAWRPITNAEIKLAKDMKKFRNPSRNPYVQKNLKLPSRLPSGSIRSNFNPKPKRPSSAGNINNNNYMKKSKKYISIGNNSDTPKVHLIQPTSSLSPISRSLSLPSLPSLKPLSSSLSLPAVSPSLNLNLIQSSPLPNISYSYSPLRSTTPVLRPLSPPRTVSLSRIKKKKKILSPIQPLSVSLSPLNTNTSKSKTSSLSSLTLPEYIRSRSHKRRSKRLSLPPSSQLSLLPPSDIIQKITSENPNTKDSIS